MITIFKNRRYLIPTLALSTLLLVSIFTTSSVSAFEGGFRSDLINKLAQRFNLNEEEVQEFFDEMHEEREAERAALLEEKLDVLVANGTITNEQKDSLLAIHADLHAQRMESMDATKKQRMALREEHHQAITEWENQTGVSLRELWGEEHSLHLQRR